MITDEMWLQGMANLQSISYDVHRLVAFCVLLGILIVIILLWWFFDKIIFQDM